MATLTKKQEKELEAILGHIGRAIQYVERESTVIAMRCDRATTTAHYRNAKNGDAIYPVDKRIGSDITGLYAAQHKLTDFIAMNKRPPK